MKPQKLVYTGIGMLPAHIQFIKNLQKIRESEGVQMAEVVN
jgi:hypothetical protein